MAIQDRNRHWKTEADNLEQMWQEGRTQELYSIARIYSGKRRLAGILHLTDPKGKPLDTPEARMSEWTRKFKRRFNPHVPVDYDCTSEASKEEWNDDARDDDATSDSPEERWRRKNAAISNLIRGHQRLLVDPTKDEVQQGLMSSKLHRAAGQDGITAELVRAALPWLTTFITLVWQWTVACAHVAQTWKEAVTYTHLTLPTSDLV